MANPNGEPFSYSEGEYGHRVRVYARPGRRNLYIEFWDPREGKIIPRSLKHSDEELARTQCRDVSDAVRLGSWDLPALNGVPGSNRGSVEGFDASDRASPEPERVLTVDGDDFIGWKRLFRHYHKKVGRHKKGSGPREDLRRAKIWVCYLRKFGIKSPTWLDEDDLRDFVRLRLKGELRVPFVTLRTAVTSRAPQADCVFLVTALNWGARVKDPRQPQRKLLAKNKIRVPGGLDNKNPSQPMATHDDVLALRREANGVDPQGLYREFERLHDALGWRVTGMCSISAADVSFEPEPYMPYGHVKKNAHVDKEGCGDAVPLSLRARAIIRRIFRTRGISCGDREWLFPAPKNSNKPWSRWHARDLMNRAEKAAAVAHLGGSHSIRRKWASERKGHPLVDVMMAGGWSDERSLRSYMQDDAETTYEVVSQPTRRIRRAKPRNGNGKKG